MEERTRMMFMMFHTTDARRPWLIAFFGLLLLVGASLLLWSA
jgi:hypothetical protein